VTAFSSLSLHKKLINTHHKNLQVAAWPFYIWKYSSPPPCAGFHLHCRTEPCKGMHLQKYPAICYATTE